MPDTGNERRAAEAVRRLERAVMDAIRDRDLKALGRLLTDDFVYRSPGGEQSRAEFLEGVANIPGRILSVEGAGQRVNVYGETAVLTGVQRARVKTDDGAEHESAVAFTDVFVKRRGRWRLALAHGVELPAPPDDPKRRQ